MAVVLAWSDTHMLDLDPTFKARFPDSIFPLLDPPRLELEPSSKPVITPGPVITINIVRSMIASAHPTATDTCSELARFLVASNYRPDFGGWICDRKWSDQLHKQVFTVEGGVKIEGQHASASNKNLSFSL